MGELVNQAKKKQYNRNQIMPVPNKVRWDWLKPHGKTFTFVVPSHHHVTRSVTLP